MKKKILSLRKKNSMVTKTKISWEKNFREQLTGTMMRAECHRLCDVVSGSSECFDAMFALMFDADRQVAWHAAWVCEQASRRSPWLFTRQAVERVLDLAATTPLAGVQRLTLTMLLRLGLPEEMPVAFINRCFERMMSPQSPVAVQVQSMKLLHGLARREPAFREELRVCLEAADIDCYTTGYRTARRKVLADIGKMA